MVNTKASVISITQDRVWAKDKILGKGVYCGFCKWGTVSNITILKKQSPQETAK